MDTAAWDNHGLTIGTIGYDCASGLGRLTKAFYDAKLVQRVLVRKHPNFRRYPDWFAPDHRYSWETQDAFLDGLDVLFILEGARGWQTVARAKERGIRLVVMPMYEYTPFPPRVEADLYLCPSLLDLRYYDRWPSVFLPVPVCEPWRLCSRARTFVHNAGHGGRAWRNGTPELLEAMRRVDKPIKLEVRLQPGHQRVYQLMAQYRHDRRVSFTLADLPYERLWATGDVFVFPETFNGLSLPLQEAHATGMLVIATDRFPMNTWLPREPLVPVHHYVPDRCAVDFERAVVSSTDLARVLDHWYDRPIEEYSLRGKAWAEEHSWEKLAPRYVAAFRGDLDACVAA